MTALELETARLLVSRAQWGARPPRSSTALRPTFGTTVHYEGPTMGAYDHASCASKVRGIQAFHMGPSRGWVDLAYTAIVCRHGRVYEGRWVGKRTAAQGTNAGNATAYAVCALIGAGDPTPPELLHGIAVAAAYLQAHGGAGDGLNGHHDWHATACPGALLYGALPGLRAAKASLLASAAPTPPAPLPPITVGPDYREDAMRPYHATIDTDDQGRGYRDVDADPNKVCSVVPNADNPADGWGPPVPVCGTLNVGGRTRVVIKGAAPHGRVDVTVWSL